MNSLKELILKSRSYRRFDEDVAIDRDALVNLVDLARLSPSGGNLQPLKFFVSNKKARNAEIFECLSWAGYLRDWDGPRKGERPSAYIVIIADHRIKNPVKNDQGIAAQSIMLGAAELGLGGCIIGSVNRAKLSTLLDLAPHFEILLVLALGRPKEKVVIEPVTGENIQYWRDADGVHHVPKRNIFDLIIT